ncbi:unnamed protein product [Schistosoma turkestanicum]|nr:unnamed protein product [Schistosoma turkestanicum]
MNGNHMTTMITLICIEFITSKSVKTIGTTPWYMQKEHLIHRFHNREPTTDNKKLSSIRVHDEEVPVVPMSVAVLIDPELASEHADASDKTEYVHSF